MLDLDLYDNSELGLEIKELLKKEACGRQNCKTAEERRAYLKQFDELYHLTEKMKAYADLHAGEPYTV